LNCQTFDFKTFALDILLPILYTDAVDNRKGKIAARKVCRWLLAVAVFFCTPLSSPLFCSCGDCPAAQAEHHGHHSEDSMPTDTCQCDCAVPFPLSDVQLSLMVKHLTAAMLVCSNEPAAALPSAPPVRSAPANLMITEHKVPAALTAIVKLRL
jgi:hypothetical protein